jgi:hypothetical protein
LPRISNTGLTIWNVPACREPKQNAGRASSSAAMNDSAKNAVKRWVDSCSRPSFRMYLLVSVCCAGLPASLLSPF